MGFMVLPIQYARVPKSNFQIESKPVALYWSYILK